MSALLYPKETLVAYIQTSNDLTRLSVFQVLDTLQWYLEHHGRIPSLPSLNIAAEVTPVALFILGYISTHPPDVRSEELALVYALRPVGYPAMPVLSTSDTKFWRVDPISELLQVRDHKGHKKYDMVRNLAHARLLATELQQVNNQKGVTEGTTGCTDFPEDPAEVKELVNGMFDAMTNMEGIIDDINNYKVQRVANSTNIELLLLAWKLVYYIRDAQDGNIFMSNRQGNLPQYHKYDDYMSRYGAVLEAVKGSKSLVYDMMAFDVSRRLAAAPEREVERKKSSKDGNKRKNAILRAATEAASKQQAKVITNADETSMTSSTRRRPSSRQTPASVSSGHQPLRTLAMSPALASPEYGQPPTFRHDNQFPLGFPAYDYGSSLSPHLQSPLVSDYGYASPAVQSHTYQPPFGQQNQTPLLQQYNHNVGPGEVRFDAPMVGQSMEQATFASPAEDIGDIYGVSDNVEQNVPADEPSAIGQAEAFGFDNITTIQCADNGEYHQEQL